MSPLMDAIQNFEAAEAMVLCSEGDLAAIIHDGYRI